MSQYPTVPLPVSTHDIELLTMHLENAAHEANRALWWAKTINTEVAESLGLTRRIDAIRSLLLINQEMTTEIAETIKKRRHGSHSI